MTTEKELLDKLTEKLIEIALEPKKRKAFELVYATDASHETTIKYYKDYPTISNIEAYTLAMYYCQKLCSPHSKEDEGELISNVLSAIDTISANYCQTSDEITEMLGEQYKSENNEDMLRFCRLFLKEKSKTFEGISLNDFDWFISLLRQNKTYERLVARLNDIGEYIMPSKLR